VESKGHEYRRMVRDGGYSGGWLKVMGRRKWAASNEAWSPGSNKNDSGGGRKKGELRGFFLNYYHYCCCCWEQKKGRNIYYLL